MSKLIRSSTNVQRPAVRRPEQPIYVIATGGEVFVAKRMKGALTWVPATEADFGVKPVPVANDGLFNNPECL